MPICEQFAVVVVPFPFVELPVTKRRPALALADSTFMQANGHGLFAMITTAKHSAWPSDILIEGWREAGLTVPSILRWKLFTLSEDAVLRHLGQLTPTDQAQAERGLTLVLGAGRIGWS